MKNQRESYESCKVSDFSQTQEFFKKEIVEMNEYSCNDLNNLSNQQLKN